MKQIEVVAAIIHDDEGRIFATQRGCGDMKDGWEFPGGKMEPGESPEEALKREIWEELETRIVIEQLVQTVEYDYPKFHLKMHCFWCHIESGRLTLKEHEASRWLSKNQFDCVDWLPADRIVVEKIKEQARRHKNMAAIHSKDTKPEMIVRRGLWKRGFRYRLNSPKLPGHPDLVLRKYRTCVFVNGCFWHGHHVEVKSEKGEVKSERGEVKSSECCKIPRTNREFWVAKIRRNQERDTEEQKRLAEMGWHCITVWECELKPSKREDTLTSLAYTLNRIWLKDHAVVGQPYPDFEEEGANYLKAAEE